VGLYKLNPVDPQLDIIWFQPLNLKYDFLLSKFAFKCSHLYRYIQVLASFVQRHRHDAGAISRAQVARRRPLQTDRGAHGAEDRGEQVSPIHEGGREGGGRARQAVRGAAARAGLAHSLTLLYYFAQSQNTQYGPCNQSENPSRVTANKPIDDTQHGPCSQSDTREWSDNPARRRTKHFTAGAVFQEIAAAARERAREAAASLAAAEENKIDKVKTEAEAEAASAEAARVARQTSRVAARAADTADHAVAAAAAAADHAVAVADAKLGDSRSSDDVDDDADAQLGDDAIALLGDASDAPDGPSLTRNATNSAYMYAFLHIHKCGGTFVESQMQAAAEANLGSFGQDEKAIHAPLFEGYPLLELLTPEVGGCSS
jgi:hypothetical protein